MKNKKYTLTRQTHAHKQTVTNLKCVGRNLIVYKERIYLWRNHSAVQVLDFDIGNVDMYSRDTCAIASEWVVEHNGPT